MTHHERCHGCVRMCARSGPLSTDIRMRVVHSRDLSGVEVASRLAFPSSHQCLPRGMRQGNRGSESRQQNIAQWVCARSRPIRVSPAALMDSCGAVFSLATPSSHISVSAHCRLSPKSAPSHFGSSPAAMSCLMRHRLCRARGCRRPFLQSPDFDGCVDL